MSRHARIASTPYGQLTKPDQKLVRWWLEHGLAQFRDDVCTGHWLAAAGAEPNPTTCYRLAPRESVPRG